MGYTSVWPAPTKRFSRDSPQAIATASAEFVRRFQRRVYGLAKTIVGDPGTAEDVAQEAFVRAWRYAASYDARRGTVPTWLLRSRGTWPSTGCG